MLCATYSELFSAELIAARDTTMREIGYDFTLSPWFWEKWVAQVTGGDVTEHKAAFDIVASGWRDFRFEVKFSRGFSATFPGGPRRVFKWARTGPQMLRTEKPDAVILIGVDREMVWTWAARSSEILGSSTITVPDIRLGGRSRYDALLVPPTDLLPALMRVSCTTCHLRYDAAHHAKNAAVTRRNRRAAGDLFTGGQPNGND